MGWKKTAWTPLKDLNEAYNQEKISLKKAKKNIPTFIFSKWKQTI